MTYWAIVPVKPLRRSKSRLSKVLSREQRASLSEEMLVHTLQVLEQVPAIERTLVVSRDSQALSLARRHGARTVTERGSPELNNALIRATLVAKTYGAAGVLILPADLPLIKKEDVLTLLELGQEPPVVVIVPDRHKTRHERPAHVPTRVNRVRFRPGEFQPACCAGEGGRGEA